MNWIIAGSGFGLQFEGTYLRWIYWAAGTQTQEGVMRRGTETMGIVPWQEGQTRHMHRPENEIFADLIGAGIVAQMQIEIIKRTQPTAAEALAKWLFDNCPHLASAMLLSKAGVLDSPRHIPGLYRHMCTPYNAMLAQGGDRVTLGLRYHNDLIEMLQFYQEHKETILSCECCSTALDEHKRLAAIDHASAISAVLTENDNRRSQEAMQRREVGVSRR